MQPLFISAFTAVGDLGDYKVTAKKSNLQLTFFFLLKNIEKSCDTTVTVYKAKDNVCWLKGTWSPRRVLV